MMADLELQRTNLTLKRASDMNADLSGIIGLAGEASGSVVLNFPLGTVSGVVSKFIGVPVADPRDHEALDAIGELTNIVAGGAKAKLLAQGLRVNIGLPTIILGHKHSVSRPRGVPTVCVHWTCTEGDFILEVCLKRAESD